MEKGKVSGLVIVAVAVAVVCIGGIAAVAYLNPFGAPEETVDWNVTLIGSGGAGKVLTFDEIRAMPSYKGYGGFFTTVGIVNGPYKCKGVPLEDLCELVGGLDASNTVWVSAPDGYLMTFSYDQVNGDFRTYDPATFKEVPHEDLTLILMYEQDDAPLSDYDGRPLRLAIVSSSSSEEFLTEGHSWVKWVNKMEVRTPAASV
ncbi:molybdopterin-binding oxidoreductase [ANME-1 cluster archaeon GoMg4]|nr:molybdopterin-binding oxidoreductase [ANME-1 cluster archaeon GoMg4]